MLEFSVSLFWIVPEHHPTQLEQNDKKGSFSESKYLEVENATRQKIKTYNTNLFFLTASNKVEIAINIYTCDDNLKSQWDIIISTKRRKEVKKDQSTVNWITIL